MRKGAEKYVLNHGTHRIKYTATCPMLFSADEKPVHAVNTGSGSFTLRNFKGTLSVDPSDAKQPYNVEINSKEFVKGEQFDDKPVPMPLQSPNWLTQMRERVKLSMGIMREEFAEQGKTMYEVTDDEAEQLRQSVISQHEKQSDTSHEAEGADPPNTTSEGKESD